ncbi:MAG: hypothetical protein PHG66_00485 [Candidatus Colwellbacteria bacterium]|nr:hypothetical protein [Candidatus Colwellbacteria bacterium]
MQTIPLSISIICFIGLLGTFFVPGKVPEVSSCDRCLYNSCSSSYLLLSCGDIQNNNMDNYFNTLRDAPDEMDRIILYSRMYGKNMGECFSDSRSYCRQTHCAEECGVSDTVIANKNTVTVKDTETFALQNTKVVNYVVSSDSCYVRELDVTLMFTKCILSPFRDDCTGTFSRNASRHCM